jgi:hypothetical protein
MTLHPPRDQSLQDHRGGPSPVLMLVMAAVFPAPMLWQLTRARKSGKGLVPCNAGGTGA